MNPAPPRAPDALPAPSAMLDQREPRLPIAPPTLDSAAPACSAAGTRSLPSASAPGVIAEVRPSTRSVNPIRSGLAALSAGDMNAAPNRPRAARALARAPVNVSAPFLAAPPMPAAMAASKVLKSIWPLVTISEISAEVLPRWVPSSCNTGMPDDMSWSMSSPCSLPRAATLPKMVPTSVRDRPEIAATSATVDSVLVISSPFLTPAAAIMAATLAASPRP